MKEKILFLALDKANKEDVLDLLEKTSGFNFAYKIGPRLAMKYGAAIVSEVAKHGPVFVDNKYYDIPDVTVANVKSTFEAGATYCTVHAQCGPEALEKLAQLETELNTIREFRILAVTILTSFNKQTLPATHVDLLISEQVMLLAEQAYNCGIKGFVCSAHEVSALKAKFPDTFLVTPGIRFNDEDSGDQKRVMQPDQAFQQGSSAIVVGRPIYNAKNVREAAANYADAIKS